MLQIAEHSQNSTTEIARYRHAISFAPAGQATQMIIGASPDSDYQIVRLASGLYKKYRLRRVFYSAYVPVADDQNLPSLQTKPPLLREHRLYQADFLMRQYQFSADEILSETTPNLNPYLDPKCNWAINNMDRFPVDVNTAPVEMLLRIPGIGPTSVKRIVVARKTGRLTLQALKRMGVVLKRAQYFIITEDMPLGLRTKRETTVRALVDPSVFSLGVEQLSLFQENGLPPAREATNGLGAVEVAIRCLAQSL
jgi:predicted DNA-binding helix-hairpin-helix protein